MLLSNAKKKEGYVSLNISQTTIKFSQALIAVSLSL